MELKDLTPAKFGGVSQGDTVWVRDGKTEGLRACLVSEVVSRKSMRVQLSPFVRQTFRWDAKQESYLLKDRYSVLELLVPKA